jgi:hypothetical protein
MKSSLSITSQNSRFAELGIRDIFIPDGECTRPAKQPSAGFYFGVIKWTSEPLHLYSPKGDP